jgi:hypothetical protein
MIDAVERQTLCCAGITRISYLGFGSKALLRPRMNDAGTRKPLSHEPIRPRPQLRRRRWLRCRSDLNQRCVTSDRNTLSASMLVGTPCPVR